MTPDRANQIIADAKAKAVHGPWSDQLSRVMTEDERDEVVAVWNTMPGYANFVTSLRFISLGAHLPAISN